MFLSQDNGPRDKLISMSFSYTGKTYYCSETTSTRELIHNRLETQYRLFRASKLFILFDVMTTVNLPGEISSKDREEP